MQPLAHIAARTLRSTAAQRLDSRFGRLWNQDFLTRTVGRSRGSENYWASPSGPTYKMYRTNSSCLSIHRCGYWQVLVYSALRIIFFSLVVSTVPLCVSCQLVRVKSETRQVYYLFPFLFHFVYSFTLKCECSYSLALRITIGLQPLEYYRDISFGCISLFASNCF